MKADVYEIINNQIIEKLEQGTIPWKKPWNINGQGFPSNYVTKEHYHGINIMFTAMQGHSSPYWLTYKQCQESGGQVKKGEKGTKIVYWNIIEKTVTDSIGNETIKKIPFLRYWTIFNVEQCERLTIDKPKTVSHDPIAECENIINGFADKPEITYKAMDRACYFPQDDKVQLPPMESFPVPEEYYDTLFHELVHSTGHESRLKRDKSFSFFGSESYSKEELVAEMGAAYLCGLAGIERKTIDNSAAYIKAWISRLRDDKTMLVSAGSLAKKAVEYIQK